MFSRVDTVPECDSQPASQPPSHVAVAITLNAKASSLKIRTPAVFKTNMWHLPLTPVQPVPPVGPLEPRGPDGPRSCQCPNIGPVAPVSPVNPGGPCRPQYPQKPVLPVSPVAPMYPGGPFGPEYNIKLIPRYYTKSSLSVRCCI